MGTSSIGSFFSSFLLFQLPQRYLRIWSLRRREEKGGREERRAEGIEIEVVELEVSLLFSFVLRTSRIEADLLFVILPLGCPDTANPRIWRFAGGTQVTVTEEGEQLSALTLRLWKEPDWD